MAKKNTGSNYHIGVFANMREIYLRNNKPTLYKRLRESGELVKHLKAFQNHHAAIAQEMHQRLAEERGVDQRMWLFCTLGRQNIASILAIPTLMPLVI